MPASPANANLASSLTSQASNFLPKLWKKGAEICEQDEDFFSEFEGKGLMAPIRVETDFTKDAGQTIQFRNRAGLYGDGVRGDALIGDTVEEWKVGQYDLTVDYLRHATRRNLRTEDQTAMRDEIAEGVNEDLGKWLGRKKTKDISMMLRHRLHDTSKVIADVSTGSKTSSEALKSADVITMNGIITWGQQLKTMGGMPGVVGKTVDKNPIKAYTLVSPGEALVALKTAADYKQAQRDCGVRGDDNVIFRGAYSRIDGHVVREWNPLDHDGRGAIGCASLPKAVLGEAVASSTGVGAALTLKGGGDATSAAITTAMYFEHFSNYAYLFGNSGTTTGSLATLAAADWNKEGLTKTGAAQTLGLAAKRYCLIYNVTASAAGGDAGKMGFYEFTTNNGNTLVLTSRLTDLAAGIGATTVGNVGWNTGVWLNKHCQDHPVGSIIIETNSYGVPFGYSFLLGAQAAVRGYGRFRADRTEQTYEGGFVKDVFITSVFGQCPKPRSDGRTTNVLRILHAVQYAGLSIPTVS
jgi:hypothetical protein